MYLKYSYEVKIDKNLSFQLLPLSHAFSLLEQYAHDPEKIMFRILCLCSLFIYSLLWLDPANAQSRFQQIQQGVNESTRGSSGNDDEAGSVTEGEGPMGAPKTGLNDTIFLGMFEIYIPTRKFNARFSIYGEPRKFLLGHRACTKTRRIRDQINAYLFSNPPKVDRKGQADTTGMDAGVREAIKKALKTKLEYFTSIYVFSGLYNVNSKPKDLAEINVTDCAGVIEKHAEMNKEK
ncbi:MAG: hypothetical protein HWE30_08390 [Methylocystaceae bacterium]|nr:hypothetical protein [Methylocystaceae bacterium]